MGLLMLMMLVKSRDAGGLMLTMLASGLGRVDTRGLLMLMMLVKSRDAGGLMLMMLASVDTWGC